MADEERKPERDKSNLDNLIEQGFRLAYGLREEAELVRRNSTGQRIATNPKSLEDRAILLEKTADEVQTLFSNFRDRVSSPFLSVD